MLRINRYLSAALILTTTIAHAQTPKKDFHFEVISITPIDPKLPPGAGFSPNPTPDGFRSALTLFQAIQIAYGPRGIFSSSESLPLLNQTEILKDPVFYLIDARVANSDREAWQHQSPNHELLAAAMQSLLRDRCKMVAHEKPTQLPDYKLIVSRRGSKLKPSVPGTVPAADINHQLPSGGVRLPDPKNRITWHYYGASIDDLIDFLDNTSPSRPVHNATNLYGRYDFTLQADMTPRDRDEMIYNWPVDQLGLDLKTGTFTGFSLVIDHIEKPAPN